MQVILAGKAHPDDEEAKRSLQGLFKERWGSRAGVRVTFLEDYDLALAARLVAGCDLWANLPRPPLEASGTSGMKAALNGVLNFSVLDGWWAEAFDGVNGWAISGDVAETPEEQDARDAEAMYSLIEQEVLPLFYDRGEDGIPHGWLARVKASLASIGPRFCATRISPCPDPERASFPGVRRAVNPVAHDPVCAAPGQQEHERNDQRHEQEGQVAHADQIAVQDRAPHQRAAGDPDEPRPDEPQP